MKIVNPPIENPDQDPDVILSHKAVEEFELRKLS